MLKHIMMKWLRPLAGATVLSVAIVSTALIADFGVGATPSQAHLGEALGALDSINAAIESLDTASRLTDSRPKPYQDMVIQAIADLTGSPSTSRNHQGNDMGDTGGALGNLRRLVNVPGDLPWKPAVSSARANVLVARSLLQQASSVQGIDEYQSKLSDAMKALLVARGSPSQAGALGGLSGALSTTALGVPGDAHIVDGCRIPSSTPAYGLTGGNLIFVAVSARSSTKLPEWIAVRDVSVRNGIVIMPTAALKAHASLCSSASDPADPKLSDPKSAVELFTKAQAKQGHDVFMAKCAECHGQRLQGKSGPPIAGPKFLKKVRTLNWSVGDLRGLVVKTMPRSNPGSLSPEQYSEVLAYVLSANCFPAGDQRFPKTDTTKLNHMVIKKLKRSKPNDQNGLCL